MFVNYDYVVNRFPTADALTRMDMVVGITATLLVLEATRRTIGAALPIVAIVFLIYGFAGPWLYGWTLPQRPHSRDHDRPDLSSPPRAFSGCR